MNAFAPKHLGVGAPPPYNSVILKKTLFFAGELPPGTPATRGGNSLQQARPRPLHPTCLQAPPLTNRLGRVRLLRLAPASFLALGRESQQAIFKPAIWDEPIKGQKRKKARKLYACGPSGNINPMF